MICEANQFSVDLVATWIDRMWKDLPDVEKIAITRSQWQLIAERALLEFWRPAGWA